MQNREITMKCYKCGNSFTTDMMRYDPNKPGTLVCITCLSRKEKEKQGATQTASKLKQSEENVIYYCLKCKYSFVRKKGALVTVCPYCSSPNTLTTKTDASSLIKTAGKDEW